MRELKASIRVLLLAVAVCVTTAAAFGQSRTDCRGQTAPEGQWQQVHFAFDSDEIVDEAPFTLACLRATLEANPRYRVVLEGYADRAGSVEYNLGLSERRAEQVRALLEAEAALGENQIEVRGCGQNVPPTDSRVTRFRSRQVLIRVYDASGRPVSQENACRAVDGPGVPTSCAHAVWERASEESELDFVIATLPDPLRSGFSREFDLFLAATRRGFEEGGYSKTRQCLPWEPLPPGQKAETTGSEAEGWADIDQPGMILFDGPGATRVLMVVGETHADQVNRLALQSALRFVDPLRGDSPIKILGPTFSGTAESLAQVLSAEIGDDGQVVSGTATGDRLEQLFDGFGIPFEQLAAKNDELQDKLWEEFVPTHLGLATNRPSDLPEDAVVVLAETSPYGDDFIERGFTVSLFPMNIARLVEEYARDQQSMSDTKSDKKAEDAAKSMLRLPKRTLPLRLGHGAPPGGRLPLFNRVGTTNSMDLVLTELVSSIAKARTQIVAIAATSTYDKIFLAQYIRARAPNIRLVTFEGDLLLTHPDLGRTLRGAIVASSNSMKLEPGSGSSKRLYFPSDGAHGVYEAARRLLKPDEARPPGKVWVAAVGKGSLEPLKAYDRTANGREPGAGRPADFADRPPRGWELVLVALSLVIFGASCLVLLKAVGRHRAGLGLGSFAWDELTSDDDASADDREATKRLACVTMLLIGLAVGYLLAAFPYLNSDLTGTVTWLSVPLPQLLLVLLALAIAYLLFVLILQTWRNCAATWEETRQIWSPPQEDESDRASALGKGWRKRFTATIVGWWNATWPLGVNAILGGAAVYAFTRIRAIDPEALSRLYHFAAGINPLAPAMLMTAVPVGWLFLSLVRFKAHDALPPRFESSSLDSQHAKVPGDIVTRLRDEISPGGTPLHIGVFAGIAFLLAYLASYYGDGYLRPIRGLDGSDYDLAISVLLVICLLMGVAAGWSAWRIWAELRRLLEWVAVRLRPEKGPDWLELCGVPDATEDELKDRRHRAYMSLLENDTSGGPLPTFPASEMEELSREPSEQDYSKAWSVLLPWLSEVRKSEEPPGNGKEDRKLEEVSETVAAASRFLTWQTATLAGRSLAASISLLGFMTVAFLLLLISISAYPFEPQSVLHLWFGVMITLGAAFSIVILIQMESDKTLSAFTGASTGFSQGRNLVTRMGLLAGVPLLSVIGSQFPVVGNTIMDWFKPMLQILQ